MKYLLIIILLFVYSISFSFAQISFMPKIGITFSEVIFKNNSPIQPRVGYLAGTAVNFKINDTLSIQPEILYIQKGYQSSRPYFPMNSFSDFESSVRIDYLEIPVLAKFSAGNEHKRGYLNLGPQISIGLGGEIKYTIDGNEMEGKVKFGRQSNTNTEIFFDNRIDYGIQSGGGFGLKVGPGLLTADFRLILGFGNLFNVESFQDKSQAKSNHQTFCTNFGYFIPLSQ